MPQEIEDLIGEGLTDSEISQARSDREGLEWLSEQPTSSIEAERFGLETAAPGPQRLSARAFDLIVYFEVTSERVYNERYRSPIWPKGLSGVTIGIGYDVGYVTRERLWADWRGVIPNEMIQALEAGIGVKGEAAHQIARHLRASVDIPWSAAINVHAAKVMPRWTETVDRNLPNTRKLPPDCFGALVSLTYNRGASFARAGARYSEMRAIRQHMASERFARIPDELRAMKRLWPDAKGLRIRRDAEARLFEDGLSRPAEANVDPRNGGPQIVLQNVGSAVELEVRAGALNLRSEPSAKKGSATVIAKLNQGDRLTMTGPARRPDVDWAAVAAAGRTGFVKRMLTVQSNPGPLVDVPRDLMDVYNWSVMEATQRFDRVTYELGKKDPIKGSVDCSGWIHFVNRLAFSAVNRQAGRLVFSSGALGLLNTHSDHQVSIPGYRTKQIYSADALTSVLQRPGQLFGVNFADYAWEQNQNRVFEIDHIVQTYLDAGGNLCITQSSSSGGGVNSMRFDVWWNGTVDQLARANRVHMIDVFQLASLTTPAMGMEGPRAESMTIEADLELPEQDTSETPAG